MNHICKTSTRSSLSKFNLGSFYQRELARIVSGSRLNSQNTNQNSKGVAPSVPRHAQVVICGGGVVGSSVAYHLAARGLTDVLLLEQGRLSCGTTWHAAGLVGTMQKSVYKELISYSRNLYKWMESNGYPTGFKQCGSVNIASSLDRLIAMRRVADECRAKKIDTYELTVQELSEKCPWFNPEGVEGGFWVPEDGVCSPTDVCTSMAKMAREKGVNIVEGCRVERVLTSTEGSVKAVETSAGVVQCDRFVLCGGMWSRDLALKTIPRVHVPLQPTEHFYVVTKPIEGVDIMSPVMRDADSASYGREWGGGFLVGVFERESLPVFLEGPPGDFQYQLFDENWNHFEKYFEPIFKRFPFLEKSEIRQMTNGPESFTPDGYPLVGETPEVQRFYVAAGMNSNGIALAGGIGRTLSEIIIDGAPSVDMTDMDIKRCFPHQANKDFLWSRGQEIVGHKYQLYYPKQSQFESGRCVHLSPLYGHHKWRGAVFGSINDYEVPLWFPKTHQDGKYKGSFRKPIWFDDVQNECHAAKEEVAIIDLTGQWGACTITCARRGLSVPLERLFYHDLRLPIGSLVKTGMLDPNGQYITECLLLSLANDRYMLIYPMATETSVLNWLKHCLYGNDINVTDSTVHYTFLAMIGPKVPTVLKNLQVVPTHQGLFNVSRFGSSNETLIFEHPLLSANNIFGCVPKQDSLLTYETLLSQGASPIGYHALETIRVQEGIPWWGHELTSNLTPLTAGRGSEVLNQTKAFIGKSPLTKGSGTQRSHSLIHLSIPSCNADQDVWFWGGEPLYMGKSYVGNLSSVVYSFDKKEFVGLAQVSRRSVDTKMEQIQVVNAGIHHDVNVIGFK